MDKKDELSQLENKISICENYYNSKKEELIRVKNEWFETYCMISRNNL